jgi:hypothetical protein
MDAVAGEQAGNQTQPRAAVAADAIPDKVEGLQDGPETAKPAHSGGFRGRARQDLNLRPSAPEADALSTELRAPVRLSVVPPC